MFSDLYEYGRPDVQSLTKGFGVKPPQLFVRFAQAVWDRAGGDTKRAGRLYWHLTGLRTSGVNSLYDSTPRELFAVGDTGGDGEHAGFMVYAPEVNADDYSWVLFAPAGASLALLANDTTTFLFQLLSYHLAHKENHHDDIQAVADDLSLPLDLALGAKLGYLGWAKYWETPEKIRPKLNPAIPPGWRFEPTRDDVGVLAPLNAFKPDFEGVDPKSLGVDPTLELVDQMLKEDFPATALFVARTLASHFNLYYNNDRWSRVNDAMKKSYRALGRDYLAERMDHE